VCVQLEMFGHVERKCRECGKAHLPTHPDALSQDQWDNDDGTLWAQSMGFCSKWCFQQYTAYHEYLTRDDREKDED
jgi:hypothetical protein